MPLSPEAILQAARLLAERRRQGQPGPLLPEVCRPTDIDSALAIQAAVTSCLGSRIGAWKCGLPVEGKLVVAPIYAEAISTDSLCQVWAREGRVRVEPELAFVLGANLPARAEPYLPAEVDAAIARTHLALELIDSRYAQPDAASFADMLADNLVNQGLFLGPAVDSADAERAATLTLDVDDDLAQQRYSGQHPAGLPRAPLYWLAEHLRMRGLGLQAGQVVITGSYAGVIELPLAAESCLRFGELGTLTVRFAPRSVR
ncbi:fumarylacetoacetate hydrolase family protein [Neisseriaceae bacterium JH1-16]|nr:fumarylacetoacetate hydrolase family protein [Neisseriaceae bacterium JH1-16]